MYLFSAFIMKLFTIFVGYFIFFFNPVVPKICAVKDSKIDYILFIIEVLYTKPSSVVAFCDSFILSSLGEHCLQIYVHCFSSYIILIFFFCFADNAKTQKWSNNWTAEGNLICFCLLAGNFHNFDIHLLLLCFYYKPLFKASCPTENIRLKLSYGF